MSVRTDEYDLIVVGAGMAGMNAAGRAAATGARVAVLERGRVGGTCPTRGCIPTKALIRSAEIAKEIARAEEFGIRVGDVYVDFAAVMERVELIIDRGSRGAQGYLESLEGVDLVLGEASLEDATSVRVGDRVLGAPRIILATGAEPSIPPIEGLEEAGYLTSDSLLRLRALPRRLLVIGGGPIALELGQALQRLGAQVTIVEVLPRLLPSAEPELAEALEGYLADDGMTVLVNTQIERVERSPSGASRMLVTRDGVERWLEGDELLVATGRRPATGRLDLERAGIDHTGRGIAVDARLRTNQISVWAAGDVLGLPYGAFTHVARRQGVSVAENAFDLQAHDVNPDVGPTAIFTDPELVSVGMTEESAEAAGYDVRIGTSSFSGGKARAWGEERGMVKVITDAATRRILGAHVLAYHGADLIHPILVAMQTGDGTGEPIRRAYHVHPTFGEVVKSAVEQTLA